MGQGQANSDRNVPIRNEKSDSYRHSQQASIILFGRNLLDIIKNKNRRSPHDT